MGTPPEITPERMEEIVFLFWLSGGLIVLVVATLMMEQIANLVVGIRNLYRAIKVQYYTIRVHWAPQTAERSTTLIATLLTLTAGISALLGYRWISILAMVAMCAVYGVCYFNNWCEYWLLRKELERKAREFYAKGT